mmetsp:Transcript_17167/g.28425  ORF Transcript_17167/g.28425 Transcript_17167/m.28425 type:complete len:287 (-) Transcript_17167:98-958(-)
MAAQLPMQLCVRQVCFLAMILALSGQQLFSVKKISTSFPIRSRYVPSRPSRLRHFPSLIAQNLVRRPYGPSCQALRENHEEEEEEGTGGEKKEMEKEEEEDLSSYPPPPPNLTTGQIDVRIRATFKSLQRVEFIRTTWLKRLSEIPNHPKHGCPKCKIVQPNDFATQCITHGEIKAAIELHFKRHIHAERALRKADRGYSFSLGSIGTAKPIMQCATRGGEGISLIYIGEPEAALWCKVPAAPAAPAAPVAVSSSTAEAVVVSSNGEGKDSSASQAVTTVMPVSSA